MWRPQRQLLGWDRHVQVAKRHFLLLFVCGCWWCCNVWFFCLSFCRLMVEDRMRSKHVIDTYARPHTIPRTPYHAHTHVYNIHLVYIMYILVSSCLFCEEITTLNKMWGNQSLELWQEFPDASSYVTGQSRKSLGLIGVEFRCLEDAFRTTVMNKLLFMHCRYMHNMYCMSVCGSIYSGSIL